MAAKTLTQMKFMSGITTKQLSEKMNKATYYNIVSGKTEPSKTSIKNICELFKIDELEFKRLLKNTLKINKKY